MKSLPGVSVVLILLFLSCRGDEEIIPAPPAPKETTVQEPARISEQADRPSVQGEVDFFHYKTFGDIPFRLLLPRKYDTTRQYPLHIFLHGMGERGRDNERQLDIGSSFFVADSIRNRYRAIIVYPQCPPDSYWFDEDIAEKIKALADALVDEYHADAEQISIGGFSMGAYGTFEIVAKYPGFFEAAIAISGDGDEARARSMAESRWQIFAGEKDDVVPSGRSLKMAEALQNAGASVLFTIFPNVDHGSTWVHALSEPNLFRWLFTAKNDKQLKEPHSN